MGISYHSEGFLVKFNPSLLKKFQECNLQYKLAQEHPDVVELQSAAASFGTLVHKCIEMYLQGRSVDDCVDFFKLVWDDPSVMGIAPDYRSLDFMVVPRRPACTSVHNGKRWQRIHSGTSSGKACRASLLRNAPRKGWGSSPRCSANRRSPR